MLKTIVAFYLAAVLLLASTAAGATPPAGTGAGTGAGGGAGAGAAVTDDGPVAPGKFIPSFAIIYGNPKGWPALEEAARFDLIDAGQGTARREDTAGPDGNTWRALKRLNPHIKIILYELGPGEYNTAGRLGQGWDWITANHGLGSADRWTALGAKHGAYLQSKAYSNERLMIVGNPAWQQYWLDNVFKQFLSPESPHRDVDGIFADNTGYWMPGGVGWYRQGQPEQPDVPADYYREGVYQPELWNTQMEGFLKRAVPWLAERGGKLVPNFGEMVRHPEYWQRLDAMPHPVFAAMEEGAFVHPWGGRGSFVFQKEENWLKQVNILRSLKHVRALMCVHGPVASTAPGLPRMDSTDASGNRGWDMLWYTIASFLQGYDDVRQNAYLNFTVWEYSTFFWLNEFDPAYLHLGRATGESQRVDAEAGHCYLREFRDGWVAVNPTTIDAQGVPVPRGRARVLNHDSFERPLTQPLVTRFDLPAHRGVVLLKPNRRVGNGDQRSIVPSVMPKK